jgi:hypothetical protein
MACWTVFLEGSKKPSETVPLALTEPDSRISQRVRQISDQVAHHDHHG